MSKLAQGQDRCVAWPIASDGEYSDAAVLSVADRIIEWVREHGVAFLVRNDKRAAVQWMWMSVKSALAHTLASKCPGLVPNHSQIVKLDTFPVEHCHRIACDVKNVTRHCPLPDFERAGGLRVPCLFAY